MVGSPGLAARLLRGIERRSRRSTRRSTCTGRPSTSAAIVHNLHVVRDLEARGAVFVDDETEVPEGETIVFSAHGIAPSVHANAGRGS